jgi:hypothetical protein
LEILYSGCQHPCSFNRTIENAKKLVPKKALHIAAIETSPQEISESLLSIKMSTRGRTATFIKRNEQFQQMKRRSKRSVTLETLEWIKISTGLSNRKMSKVAHELRSSVPVESGLQNHLVQLNRKFADMFKVSEESSQSSIEGSFPVVFCQDVPGFLNKVLLECGVTNLDVFLRLSIDHGRGFLKVSGSLVMKNMKDEQKEFFSSSVKRTQILAIAPVKESAESIRILIEKLKLENLFQLFDVIFAQDLKCINLCLGLGSHQSKFPCAFCLWENGK